MVVILTPFVLMVVGIPGYIIPGTQMTCLFEGQLHKTRPKLQPKQGSCWVPGYYILICKHILTYTNYLGTNGISLFALPIFWVKSSVFHRKTPLAHTCAFDFSAKATPLRHITRFGVPLCMLSFKHQYILGFMIYRYLYIVYI